jgi:hypothetical protein
MARLSTLHKSIKDIEQRRSIPLPSTDESDDEGEK